MNESIVTLSFMESSSSIHVSISSKDVRDGSAAAAFDRLRVLLAQETSLFTNMRYRLFAVVEGTETLVDLDELPKTTLTTVTLRGEQVGIETLKDELALWQARHPARRHSLLPPPPYSVTTSDRRRAAPSTSSTPRSCAQPTRSRSCRR